MSLQRTLEWFKTAKPNPTLADKFTQLGCHMEEVNEMYDTLTDENSDDLLQFSEELKNVKLHLESTKGAEEHFTTIADNIDRQQLLDDLTDQIVTAVGVAYFFGLDIVGALDEVNRSNFSKFEDGKVLLNEQGKIMKGKDYTPPDLTPFV